MGWLFRKRIKLMPGLTLNLGKRGASLTLGKRGASINVGPRGTHANVGLPGTGLSFRQRLDTPSSTRRRTQTQADSSTGSIYYVPSSPSLPDKSEPWLMLLGFIAGFFGGLYYFGSVLEWWQLFVIIAAIICGLKFRCC